MAACLGPHPFETTHIIKTGLRVCTKIRYRATFYLTFAQPQARKVRLRGLHADFCHAVSCGSNGSIRNFRTHSKLTPGFSAFLSFIAFFRRSPSPPSLEMKRPPLRKQRSGRNFLKFWPSVLLFSASARRAEPRRADGSSSGAALRVPAIRLRPLTPICLREYRQIRRA